MNELMCPENNLSCITGPRFFPPVFELEKNFNLEEGKGWLNRNIHLVFFACCEYLLLLYVCKRVMSNKAAVQLKWSLFVWDASLALISMFGVSRVGAELAYTLRQHGFEHSICVVKDIEQNPVYAFSVFIFGLCKIFELFDTLFIVLKKQKLIFLHWFHHFSVLILTAYGIADRVAMGRWFLTMNYAIHSFMYSYYALRTIKIRVPKEFSMCLTLMQISQMVAGAVLSVLVLFKWINGDGCAVSLRVVFIGSMLYSVYLFLFVQYFIDAYFRRKNSETRKKK